MTLQQLRFLREIVRQSFNITSAAAALHTSQPGVSRQILQLEQELGVDLLIRRKNRIIALTEAGEDIIAAAQRVLNEVDNIALIAEEAKKGGGTLSIVTSHLHARYTLRDPIRMFSEDHPDIRLLILQAEPDDIPGLVEHGEADVGVSTSEGKRHTNPKLALLTGPRIQRCAIMLRAHPLASKKKFDLKDFADFPMVGYNPRSSTGEIIARAFGGAGIELQFVVRANDSDVIKSYVSGGLGVGIVPSAALSEHTDAQLHAVDVTDLLPESHMSITIRRDMYLRRHLLDFIELVAPEWDRHSVSRELKKQP
jgi:LysR family cys regulon transcriptional activator